MAAKLQYIGGPWDGRIETFETNVGFVMLPVWFDWTNKMQCCVYQHYYTRLEKFLMYEGVFSE